MLKKAIVVGASGLVGSELVNLLLSSDFYQEVLVLVRKPLLLDNKKLVQLIIDFDKLEEHAEAIKGHALFCCLGTTKSKTPDQQIYRKIDHDYPVQLAQLALKNDVKEYHLVSAIGANVNSSTFYTRLKGETERDIIQLGLKCLHIYQPSLLTGDRKEFRLGEKIATVIMKLLNPLLINGLSKYKSIPAAVVAKSMYRQSLQTEEGVFIHPSNHIKKLA